MAFHLLASQCPIYLGNFTASGPGFGWSKDFQTPFSSGFGRHTEPSWALQEDCRYSRKSCLKFKKKVKLLCVRVCFPGGRKSKTDKVIKFPLLDIPFLSLKHTHKEAVPSLHYWNLVCISMCENVTLWESKARPGPHMLSWNLAVR